MPVLLRAASKESVNCPARSDQELEVGGAVTEVPPEVADLLGSPQAVRVRGDSEDMHVATWYNFLNDHRNIRACPLYVRAPAMRNGDATDGHGQRPYAQPELPFHSHVSADPAQAADAAQRSSGEAHRSVLCAPVSVPGNRPESHSAARPFPGSSPGRVG
jgi:hypothetical protein